VRGIWQFLHIRAERRRGLAKELIGLGRLDISLNNPSFQQTQQAGIGPIPR
jgi:hypothetical protein